MASFTVSLEHPVVVPVVAVHVYMICLDRLVRVHPFLRAIFVPADLPSERLILAFHQLSLRLQPELDAVPGGPSKRIWPPASKATTV